ncbi:MAG: AGE family epimerase/isomerase [Pseudomonas sp.]|uniref:AGE family epimerase/isomerase n=1 Tax=Pseudomonas sp. TaxID=306 RepID=UPI00339465D6
MPDPSRSTSSAALRDTFAQVQRHFHQVVVPLWQGPGWNPVLALPYEALLEGTPLAPQRYRAMACARQLYLFASLLDTPQEADARAHAAQLFDSLQRHFHDPLHGGWFYSIDALGQPLDRRKDLYSHAFVIFACAHYRGKVADPQVDAVLDQALDLLARHFADGDGLYHAELAEDWSDLGSGPLQNPLMHLAEALLVSLDLRPSPALATTLMRLADGMQRRFVDPERSLVLEHPLGTANNWFEPGHQFEWFYLVESSPLLRGGALHTSLQRAFEQVERLGVIDGAVQARLAPSGQLLDGTRRIWAQAEYLRALTLRPEGEARVLQQLRALQQHFLHPAGWTECREGDGRPARHDMPSTTPYHLATCYAGLAAYLPYLQ